MVRGFYAREVGGFVTGDSCLGIRSFSRVFLEPYPARYALHLPHAGKAIVQRSGEAVFSYTALLHDR